MQENKEAITNNIYKLLSEKARIILFSEAQIPPEITFQRIIKLSEQKDAGFIRKCCELAQNGHFLKILQYVLEEKYENLIKKAKKEQPKDFILKDYNHFSDFLSEDLQKILHPVVFYILLHINFTKDFFKYVEPYELNNFIQFIKNHNKISERIIQYLQNKYDTKNNMMEMAIKAFQAYKNVPNQANETKNKALGIITEQEIKEKLPYEIQLMFFSDPEKNSTEIATKYIPIQDENKEVHKPDKHPIIAIIHSPLSLEYRIQTTAEKIEKNREKNIKANIVRLINKEYDYFINTHRSRLKYEAFYLSMNLQEEWALKIIDKNVLFGFNKLTKARRSKKLKKIEDFSAFLHFLENKDDLKTELHKIKQKKEVLKQKRDNWYIKSYNLVEKIILKVFKKKNLQEIDKTDKEMMQKIKKIFYIIAFCTKETKTEQLKEKNEVIAEILNTNPFIKEITEITNEEVELEQETKAIEQQEKQILNKEIENFYQTKQTIY